MSFINSFVSFLELSFIFSLQKLQEDERRQGISAVLLAPTRELAHQLYREVTHMAESLSIHV
jgi:superfamily II DNA/RNA helicase